MLLIFHIRIMRFNIDSHLHRVILIRYICINNICKKKCTCISYFASIRVMIHNGLYGLIQCNSISAQSSAMGWIYLSSRLWGRYRCLVDTTRPLWKRLILLHISKSKGVRDIALRLYHTKHPLSKSCCTQRKQLTRWSWSSIVLTSFKYV